jgi:Xaa-Pro aminopeptidase
MQNARDSKVGLDARLISHSLAASLSVQLSEEKVELVYPSANLVDRIWDTRPAPSKELVFIQPVKYAGTCFQDESRFSV